jgi:hypothetical protein
MLLSTSVWLAACSWYHTGQAHSIQPVDAPYTLRVVQFDDQGRYWDRTEQLEALRIVEAAARRGGATVVVFIHGWHHDAGAADSNLADFAAALRDLKTEIEQPVYRAARKALFGHEDSDVVGIYIGWRGRSLPGFADYLTFWDRKPAAERIGRGDVVELLSQLDHICRRTTDKGKYTGLVTIGHSFGAQVAATAISSVIRQRIAAARDQDGTYSYPLSGFGDLVVLVNPAAEASVLEGLSEATRRARFSPAQAPVLLVVSSENDSATGWWFPMGRRLDVSDQVYRDDEYAQNIRAVGWYRPQVTHCLALEQGRACEGYPVRPVDYRGPRVSASQATVGVPSEAYAGVWTLKDIGAPEGITLGGDIGMAGVRLYRVSDAIDENQPIVVAKATNEVVNGHNGVFDRPFREFLIRYATGTELKRFLILARSVQAP